MNAAEDQHDGPVGLRLSRRAHITDVDAAFEGLQRERDALMAQIAALEDRLPSPEELAYLRNKKEGDERAAWAWRMLRTYVPWATALCGAVGSAAYWLVSHFQIRQS